MPVWPVSIHSLQKRLQPSWSALDVRIKEGENFSFRFRSGKIMNFLVAVSLCQLDNPRLKQLLGDQGSIITW